MEKKKLTQIAGAVVGVLAFGAVGIYANGEYLAWKEKEHQQTQAMRSIECDAEKIKILAFAVTYEEQSAKDANPPTFAEYINSLGGIPETTRKTLLALSKVPKTWESIPIGRNELVSTVPDRSERDAAMWSVARQLCMVL